MERLGAWGSQKGLEIQDKNHVNLKEVCGLQVRGVAGRLPVCVGEMETASWRAVAKDIQAYLEPHNERYHCFKGDIVQAKDFTPLSGITAIYLVSIN